MQGECTIAIVQHAMSHAPHWHVISGNGLIHEKYIRLEDAMSFALTKARPENIEVSN